MALPIFQDPNRNLMMMQTQWASQLNPVLAIPSITILKNVSLKVGANVINHMLQRPLQGWYIVRQRALASIYDTQDSNQNPSLTLNLTSNAVVSVDIAVF